MTYEGDNANKRRFLLAMGDDLRRLRGQTELSCEEVASVLNTTASRDRISKIERGVTGTDLFDYLRLMWFYRDIDPDHPAVELARKLLPPTVRGHAD